MSSTIASNLYAILQAKMWIAIEDRRSSTSINFSWEGSKDCLLNCSILKISYSMILLVL